MIRVDDNIRYHFQVTALVKGKTYGYYIRGYGRDRQVLISECRKQVSKALGEPLGFISLRITKASKIGQKTIGVDLEKV